MRTDGSGERLLTKFLSEAPSWSPNGRVLIFTEKQNRQTRKGFFS